MRKRVAVLLPFLLFSSFAFAQTIGVSGKVLDEGQNPIPGATIVVKGTTNGTITAADGQFKLNVGEGSTLVISYLGYTTKEIKVNGAGPYNIGLSPDVVGLDEVVVVGYGQQKKASVVGAITQTSGATLQRAAGVSNIGAALTGNLPGVITMEGSGQPGSELDEGENAKQKIVIRGTSSWNDSGPLVLVDGIERSMNSVDITSVENISVLKDASATAVYGVKGANGVILITTKRGEEGKARIDAGFTTTIKRVSKLPNKLDSYDALVARNKTIEMELPVTPKDSWEYITPQSEIEKYRDPDGLTTMIEKGHEVKGYNRERYPNVDWQEELFKKQAISYNANLSISGGTKAVRYYGSADYVYEDDLMRMFDNGRGYETGYSYQRVNARSNLDFNITKTTVFRMNLSGSLAIKKAPQMNAGDVWQEGQRWAGAYNIAPDVFLPKYEDGAWGYYPQVSNVTNSAQNLAYAGMTKTTSNTITTDFILEQQLDFLLKGLSARANLSMDNNFQEVGRGINGDFDDPQQKWIDPKTGLVYLRNDINSQLGTDWAMGTSFGTSSGQMGNVNRRLYYQAQLNWARDFGPHSITAMGMFSRNKQLNGDGIPSYREDWAFRTTYNYDGRYFFEYNGAYNGSEKFAPENRFAFFNSGAVGWMISEENFMTYLKENHYIDMLKVRASLGEIGSDNAGQFLYMDEWGYKERNGATPMTLDGGGASIYKWYRMKKLGNKDVHWETVRKFNFGIDYSFLQGLFAGSVEIFRDKRYDVLLNGSDQAVPMYFGFDLPVTNRGEVHAKGYEIEVRVNKQIKRDMRVWGNFSLTHNENKIIEKDDAPLTPNYQKEEGYAIGQYKSFIDKGFINNIDELYGSPAFQTDDRFRLPGSYYIVDFNGDGTIDSKDSAPYGYTSTPQNTYNATVGFEWKGFSCFAQFYGVRNVTRDVVLQSFGQKLNTVYDMGETWSKENTNADVTTYRWMTAPVSKEGGQFPAYGTQYIFDGSYIRLKNVELAYSWHDGWVKNIGLNYLKLFVNGNNLWLWTKMPDDREANLGGGGYLGAYPTVKRFNIGLKITL
ncbi:MAG: SusC/RagA family TonB-linked outer membrane protein [Salinivirgaceae bacterium]|nr:SusC/RagA family TonB-linked outer membrane protein [Salinivirgaceae bacterium]